ncbi:MAG: hypothetical protein AB7I01_20025 [Gammaproteobacteria bacterium]
MNARPALRTLLALVGALTLASAQADDAASLADPMRPAIVAPDTDAADDDTPAQSFALSAIKLDGPRSHAIVNGRVLHVGEQLDDARLARIEPHGVRLTTARGPLTLRLNSLEIKRHVDSRSVSR